jgi:hypothetical protein
VTEDVQAQIVSLLAERAEFARRGDKDSVALVDEQLRVRGVGPDGKPLRGKRKP